MPRLVLTTTDNAFSFVADESTLLQCAARIERRAACVFPEPLSECDDFRFALDAVRENPRKACIMPRFKLGLILNP